jgi:hypothetical protein
MSKLLLAHARDILTYVYKDKVIYRIPIYFKEETVILKNANYLELTIPTEITDLSCKIINLHKESVLPVPVKEQPKTLQ